MCFATESKTADVGGGPSSGCGMALTQQLCQCDAISNATRQGLGSSLFLGKDNDQSTARLSSAVSCNVTVCAYM